MKPGFRFEINCMQAPEIKSGSNDPVPTESNVLDSIDRCYLPRVRPSEANGFHVYTRKKKMKTSSDCMISYLDKLEATVKSDVVLNESDTVDSGTFSGGEGVMMEVEVKDELLEGTVRSDEARRFRSVYKLTDEVMEMANDEDFSDLKEAVVLDTEKLAVLGSPKTKKMEMKMSKKKMEMKMSKQIIIRGRLATVRELFETGLLNGYPVFYNGGKRGFPLRGTITDAGILCSCSLCKGVRVVPPCQFEIHACRSYRRASQYICLENGKSLLDVVKECRKSSAKTLEETIQNFIGPLPVKESIICRNCRGSFLATSAAKVEQLCDSCFFIMDSEVDAENVKTRPLEPLLGLTEYQNFEVHNTPQKKGRRGRKKRKHSELVSSTKSSGRSSLRLSTRKYGQQKITKMLLQPASATMSSDNALVRYTKSSSDLALNNSASFRDSSKDKATRNILKKLSDTSLSKSSKIESPSVSVQSKSSLKITKIDQATHKLVFEDGGLPDGTEVAYYSHGKKLRDGYKMGSGIICQCCSTLVSPSQFEAHAGWASRRKPYMYIYTSNGMSLHEFSVSLLKGQKSSSRENSDLCIICADGGKLVLCDGCPRAFHKECASLSSIPRGNWFCIYCQNMFQRGSFGQWKANAVAAGRISGIDPIEQLTNRCMRIVKNPDEVEVIACVICRGYDFSKSGFGPRTVIMCDQCEKEYHVGCLKKCKMAELKGLPKGKWFCSVNCKQIYSSLQHLLNAGAEKIPDPSLDVLRKKLTVNGLAANTDADVKWRLLNGKNRSRENRTLLSQAVAIFHDSFDPIVDSETGRDFIPSLVYGRNIRGQDFSGMYCAILTVNSKVVSAGILRIFGQEIAELPLAATRTGSRGKGYFQILYSCIEKLLAFLNIKDFVLPASNDATSLWTEKFGFEKMTQEQLLSYRKICWQMMTFKGTSLLEKAVPKCRIVSNVEAEFDVPVQ